MAKQYDRQEVLAIATHLVVRGHTNAWAVKAAMELIDEVDKQTAPDPPSFTPEPRKGMAP